MRRLAVLVATAIALATAAPALADPSAIVPGRSIGAARLGMTTDEIVRVYGRPRSVERYEFVSGEVGRLARYRKHGGAFLVTYVRGSIVSVTTAARYYRTAAGVGPGVPIARAAALPGFRFDQCSAGYVRRNLGASTLITQGPRGLVRYVTIVRDGYFDC